MIYVRKQTSALTSFTSIRKIPPPGMSKNSPLPIKLAPSRLFTSHQPLNGGKSLKVCFLACCFSAGCSLFIRARSVVWPACPSHFTWQRYDARALPVIVVSLAFNVSHRHATETGGIALMAGKSFWKGCYWVWSFLLLAGCVHPDINSSLCCLLW